MSEWIEVIEGDESTLPPDNQLVLVLKDGEVHLRSREGEEWYDENDIYDDSELEINYWQPLPKLPWE